MQQEPTIRIFILDISLTKLPEIRKVVSQLYNQQISKVIKKPSTVVVCDP